MFNLVQKRRWYFLLSGSIIGLGLAVIIYSTITTGSPFRLSIDFVGGSIYEFQFLEEGATEDSIADVFAANGEENVVIQQLGGTAESFRVIGSASETEIRNALSSLSEKAVSVGQLDEVAYTFSFTESNSTLTTDVIREAFGSDAFVREIGTEDSPSWSVIAATSQASSIESTLDTMNADTPLTFESVEGMVYQVNLEADEISEQDIIGRLQEANLGFSLVQRRPYRWSVRGGFEDQATNDQIMNDLEAIAPLDRSSLRVSSVSETVGREVTRSAFFAVVLGAFVITGFIVIAFRQIPKAVRYGLCAIAAMVHDVLVVMGVMSLMGLIAGWEIDALFLTAVLTVVGFSVQDTIVIFDRIRENIPKHLGESYETIINRSIWETIHRSLATQLNTFFVMAAILLFGGDTIKQFIAILFVGLLSGTYSSIFVAVPLLVSWEKGQIPFLKGDEAFEEAKAAS